MGYQSLIVVDGDWLHMIWRLQSNWIYDNIDVLMRLIYHNCYIQGYNHFYMIVGDDWWALIMDVYWYNEALDDSNQSWAQWGSLIKWLVKIS